MKAVQVPVFVMPISKCEAKCDSSEVINYEGENIVACFNKTCPRFQEIWEGKYKKGGARRLKSIKRSSSAKER